MSLSSKFNKRQSVVLGLDNMDEIEGGFLFLPALGAIAAAVGIPLLNRIGTAVGDAIGEKFKNKMSGRGILRSGDRIPPPPSQYHILGSGDAYPDIVQLRGMGISQGSRTISADSSLPTVYDPRLTYPMPIHGGSLGESLDKLSSFVRDHQEQVADLYNETKPIRDWVRDVIKLAKNSEQ